MAIHPIAVQRVAYDVLLEALMQVAAEQSGHPGAFLDDVFKKAASNLAAQPMAEVSGQDTADGDIRALATERLQRLRKTYAA